MIDINKLKNQRLVGGFAIVEIEFTAEPMMDALEREAIAQTRIIGREFRLLIRSGLTEDELSITLYHEILEAATVAAANPPASVLDFNEGNFETEAHAAHVRWGCASEQNLNRLLQFFGFGEK